MPLDGSLYLEVGASLLYSCPDGLNGGWGYLTVLDGKQYFTAEQRVYGNELWAADSTMDKRRLDVLNGSAESILPQTHWLVNEQGDDK